MTTVLIEISYCCWRAWRLFH